MMRRKKIYDSSSLKKRIAFRSCILAFIFAAAFLFVSTRTEKSSAQAPQNSCIECHSQMEGPLGEPAKLFEHDIHAARGLSCKDCHGGDPAKSDIRAAKGRGTGFIGKPRAADIPAFCGKCHSDATVMKKFNPSLRVDQAQEYFTSVHGMRLKQGDTKVATCVSCHGVHGIRAVNDSQSSVYPRNVAETCAKCHSDAERMGSYKIAHDQYDKYKMSVHYKALYEKNDLSAPTCNDCHGNHGAVPPGISSVANICGQCHSRQSELFQNSPHKAAFEKMQVGECIRCHNNHDIAQPTDEMVGVGQKSACIACHTNDKGFTVAQDMHSRIEGFQAKIHSANEILERAERAGMEVSRPKFELKDANDALTQARVMIHASSLEELDKTITPGTDVATKSYEAGQAAFAELAFRRRGLIVSLVFILFLAFLVFLKIRQIERKDAPA